jgi:preprotein translocase SecE subunit
MASLNNQENIVTTEAEEPADEKPRARAEKPTSQSGGFFTIYKHGQGYWTRLCTSLAAAVILVLTVNFIWQNVPPYLRPALTPANPTPAQLTAADTKAHRITMSVCAVLLIGGGLLLWKIINSPTNSDFLIATDSEMKKVNWTSRQELIGSTKVVIFFMFIIAVTLFLVDIFFGYLFFWIGVLKSPPL